MKKSGEKELLLSLSEVTFSQTTIPAIQARHHSMINLREMNVLIVDDMENMYTSIRSIMRLLKFGRNFFYAEDADKALQILRTDKKINMLFLDNNMPGIKGVDLLYMIREDREFCDIPVVMITADATQDFVTNAAESEIDAYILKPITVGIIKNKIPKVVDKANNPTPMMQNLKSAAVLAEKGDFDKAIKLAQLARKANPDSSRPFREIGYYYLKKGDNKKAEQYLLHAAEMNRIDVVAFNNLGELYLKQDDIDRAMVYFTRAIEISPRNFDRGINLGKILIQKKLFEKAIPIFNNVLKLSKNQLAHKKEIADFCIEFGASQYAGKLLKNIVKMQPESPEELCKLGRIALEAEDLDEALACFVKAEELDDTNTDIKLHIAHIHIQRGMLIKAEVPLTALLKINPDNKEARKLLRQCV